MTRDELEARLRAELSMPFYNAKIAERDYSEAEFQQMKAELAQELIDYADNYINYADNDV